MVQSGSLTHSQPDEISLPTLRRQLGNLNFTFGGALQIPFQGKQILASAGCSTFGKRNPNSRCRRVSSCHSGRANMGKVTSGRVGFSHWRRTAVRSLDGPAGCYQLTRHTLPLINHTTTCQFLTNRMQYLRRAILTLENCMPVYSHTQSEKKCP